ncbi:hypothetical protein ATANTOWER_008455 [Ataeniobius toweri]|uniref:Uncharacterized protein n=1 Tax=Ataeniobius toweri TaxID=208326 RepID=A0ABU7CGA9_9TELE|nr:hypothetical protein [Ataeniobius toweri]
MFRVVVQLEGETPPQSQVFCSLQHIFFHYLHSSSHQLTKSEHLPPLPLNGLWLTLNWTFFFFLSSSQNGMTISCPVNRFSQLRYECLQLPLRITKALLALQVCHTLPVFR